MNMISLESCKVGDRVAFAEERQAYTVQARNFRWLVCTKPFNPRKTVLYCIIDLQRMIRGPESLVFGMGAETRKQCEQMLDRVTAGKSDISYRNNIPVVVRQIKRKPMK